MNDTEYSLLKRKIRQLLHIDVEAYKPQQMRRRLEALVSRRAAGSAPHFCKALDRNQQLVKELQDVLTINVSEFFRDPMQFHQLRSIVLPELLKKSPRLNIWTAGCSHGAEPYSVAMVLDETPAGARHRILATDVDEDVLRLARAAGPYRPAEVKNLPSWQIRKYFTVSNDGYTLIDRIRNRVEFRKHNLLSDRFETGFDLLLCRNVMIYFSNEAKHTLFQRFHQAIKPGGVLFLGATEALLGEDAEGFERMLSNFYRKRSIAATQVLGKAA